MLNLTGAGHIPTEIFREISPLLAIPEPSTAILLALSGLGLALHYHQRRRKFRR